MVRPLFEIKISTATPFRTRLFALLVTQFIQVPARACFVTSTNDPLSSTTTYNKAPLLQKECPEVAYVTVDLTDVVGGYQNRGRFINCLKSVCSSPPPLPMAGREALYKGTFISGQKDIETISANCLLEHIFLFARR